MLAVEAINDFLQCCERLESLSFSGFYAGRMEGSILESIVAICRNLQRIDLSYSSCFPLVQLATLLENCTTLTYINVRQGSSWVEEDFIRVLTHCPQLQSLIFDGYGTCGDSAVQALAQYCRDLRHLSLKGWYLLTDVGVSSLTACRELRQVDLSSNTRITSQSIITLAQGCTKLEDINLPRCDKQLDTAIAALVQNCPALNTLRFCSMYFTDRSLQSLQNCPLLHTLELKQADKIKFTALLQLLEHCPALRRLELPLISFHCAGIATYSAIVFTAEQFSLEYIDFAKFDSLTDAAFITLLSRCPYITQLNISNCTGLTDESIVAVASNCRKLEVLNIGNISTVTDATVCAIAKSCCHLRSLNVAGCKLITDVTASAVGNNCPNLRYLNLMFCPKLTDAGVVEIIHKCCLLRELVLNGCGNITFHTVDAIVQFAARLRVLNLNMCDMIDTDIITSFRRAKPNCKLFW